MGKVCEGCGNPDAYFRNCTKEWLCDRCKQTDKYKLITRTSVLENQNYGLTTDELIGEYQANHIHMFSMPNAKGKYLVRVYYEREIRELAERKRQGYVPLLGSTNTQFKSSLVPNPAYSNSSFHPKNKAYQRKTGNQSSNVQFEKVDE